MPAEQLDLTLEGCGTHGDILPSNFHDVKAICPRPSGRSDAMSRPHQGACPYDRCFSVGHDAQGGAPSPLRGPPRRRLDR